MGIVIRVRRKTGLNMARGYIRSRTVLFTRVVGRIIRCRVRVSYVIHKGGFSMMGSGIMMSFMDGGF